MCYSGSCRVCVNAISNQAIEHGLGDIITGEQSYNPRISVMELATKNRVKFNLNVTFYY